MDLSGIAKFQYSKSIGWKNVLKIWMKLFYWVSIDNKNLNILFPLVDDLLINHCDLLQHQFLVCVMCDKTFTINTKIFCFVCCTEFRKWSSSGAAVAIVGSFFDTSNCSVRCSKLIKFEGHRNLSFFPFKLMVLISIGNYFKKWLFSVHFAEILFFFK